MIYKIAEFTIQPSKLLEAQTVIKEFMAAVKQNEPNVLRYESFQDHGGNRFFHLMAFKDRKAESAHQQASHTLSFVNKLYPLCQKEPVFTTLEILEST